jgi:hypothetical protein
MACAHCPHCRDLAARSALRLPDPPANQGRAGINLDFYARYGRAYDAARKMDTHPVRLLRSANPWLTDSQAKSYLKRARSLGFVRTPSRKAVAPAAAVLSVVRQAEPASTVDPKLDAAWIKFQEVWQPTGRELTARKVAMHLDVPEKVAEELLRDAVDSGLADWSDGECSAVRLS